MDLYTAQWRVLALPCCSCVDLSSVKRFRDFPLSLPPPLVYRLSVRYQQQPCDARPVALQREIQYLVGSIVALRNLLCGALLFVVVRFFLAQASVDGWQFVAPERRWCARPVGEQAFARVVH